MRADLSLRALSSVAFFGTEDHHAQRSADPLCGCDVVGAYGLHGSFTRDYRSTGAFIGRWFADANCRCGADCQCVDSRGKHSNSHTSQIACAHGGEGTGQRRRAYYTTVGAGAGQRPRAYYTTVGTASGSDDGHTVSGHCAERRSSTVCVDRQNADNFDGLSRCSYRRTIPRCCAGRSQPLRRHRRLLCRG